MDAEEFLTEIDYYNTNVVGELYEELGIERLSDILEMYHQRKLMGVEKTLKLNKNMEYEK